MRTKAIKVGVIIAGFLVAMLINAGISGGKAGPLNPIIIIALLAFIGKVWTWKPKPKQEGNDQDKHVLKKD
jgi:hypothetical protein